METQTQAQYLPMVFEEDRARFLTHLLAETEAAFCPAVRPASQIVRVEYFEGYCLTASTQRTGAGLYPANLLVERPGNHAHEFHALGYFHDAGQAVLYAAEWGRDWVESNECESSRNMSRLEQPSGTTERTANRFTPTPRRLSGSTTASTD